MELSVIIATFNRCYNLAESIGYLANQQGMDGVDWEVLVVDNNSTDGTEKTVRKLQNEHSINLRYVFEPKQGVCQARNRGIGSTDSRYLVFIDDDILVVPGWLKAIYTTFKEKDSDAIAGRIWLRCPREIPHWMTADMRGDMGHLDLGDAPLSIDGRRRFFFGGNMAFNRRIFERVGLFDVRLGPKGEGRKPEESFQGEEHELAHRIADASGKIDYAPEAIVYHKVLAHELERHFFRVLEFNRGYQGIILSGNRFRRLFLRIPLFMFKEMMKVMFEYAKQVLISGPDGAFTRQLRIAYIAGAMCAFRKVHAKS